MHFGDCSQVFVPLRWEGCGIGTLIVVRHLPAPFRDDGSRAARYPGRPGAVVAIENTRLFNETTARRWSARPSPPEVLQVISRSVADTAPAVTRSSIAARLFDSAEQGVILLKPGGRIELAAHCGRPCRCCGGCCRGRCRPRPSPGPAAASRCTSSTRWRRRIPFHSLASPSS